jgi:3-methylfumaryl-CoA hydratase
MTAWEAWIGRTSTSSAWLDPVQANRMAATLDREPGFVAGDPLPPAWHWLYFHDIVRSSELGEEGHPALGITMPPVPLPRRMWAAGRLDYAAPLTLGTEIAHTSTVSAITPKSGSTGPLYFVTVEHDFHSGDTHCLHEEQTIVYRPMSASTELPAAERAPSDPERTTTWHLDSIALFRYSALTFNGHRIHYDVDYARHVEGYPGLVVHGPLLATLLVDLASADHRPVRHFSYRARSPVFLPEKFTVNARREGDHTRVWVANHAGGLAMDGVVG